MAMIHLIRTAMVAAATTMTQHKDQAIPGKGEPIAQGTQGTQCAAVTGDHNSMMEVTGGIFSFRSIHEAHAIARKVGQCHTTIDRMFGSADTNTAG
jgi:hypothetical protein